MNGWFIAFIVVVGLSIGVNILATVMEKSYKRKMIKNSEENNDK